ncbi:MAG TPA: hypothetical protein VGH28_05575 [Polyangiaceae bacterium]|jgi:acetyl esterase/lipase
MNSWQPLLFAVFVGCGGDVKNSLVYDAALVRAGVPVEMHLFERGGHAFGLRRTSEPITAWPRLVEAWLAELGATSAAMNR